MIKRIVLALALALSACGSPPSGGLGSCQLAVHYTNPGLATPTCKIGVERKP